MFTIQNLGYVPSRMGILSNVQVGIVSTFTRCELISLTPHGSSIAFETHDTMYSVAEQKIQAILCFVLGSKTSFDNTPRERDTLRILMIPTSCTLISGPRKYGIANKELGRWRRGFLWSR